jgi:hypothetical protein
MMRDFPASWISFQRIGEIVCVAHDAGQARSLNSTNKLYAITPMRKYTAVRQQEDFLRFPEIRLMESCSVRSAAPGRSQHYKTVLFIRTMLSSSFRTSGHHADEKRTGPR